MDTETVFEIIDHINRQIDMINEHVLNTKGGLNEVDAISTIASRNTLKQLKDYLQEYIELEVAQVEGM